MNFVKELTIKEVLGVGNSENDSRRDRVVSATLEG